jgi:hypothetical protein
MNEHYQEGYWKSSKDIMLLIMELNFFPPDQIEQVIRDLINELRLKKSGLQKIGNHLVGTSNLV